jgi:hypothetical protein
LHQIKEVFTYKYTKGILTYPLPEEMKQVPFIFSDGFKELEKNLFDKYLDKNPTRQANSLDDFYAR